MPHRTIATPDSAEPQYRFRGHISPQEAKERGARAELTASIDGDVAVIRIDDVIDSWGDFWGISAKEVNKALDVIGKDVETIQVRINSPGGEAREGVAIYNSLVSHPARIEVVVEALAASAASVIAMSGDSIEMLNGSELMIHDASAIAYGNAEGMLKVAEVLDHLSESYAAVYAERAGGPASKWRAAMKEETWYSPEEAVEAGLATKVGAKRAKATADPKAQFDLTVFSHAGRAEAPAPRNDTATVESRTSFTAKQGQENDCMTAEQLQALGLAADATDEQIDARIAELVETEASTQDPDPVDPPADPAPPADPDPEADPATTEDVTPAEPDTVTVNKVAHEETQARLAKLEAEAQARAKADADRERDAFLEAALSKGKFTPAQRSDYEAFFDANPAAAKAAIERLADNTVPVTPIGRGDDSEFSDDSAYDTSMLTKSEQKRIEAAKQGA